MTIYSSRAQNDLEISSERSSQPIYAISPRLRISHPITIAQVVFNMDTFILSPRHPIDLGYSVKVMVSSPTLEILIWSSKTMRMEQVSADPFGAYLLNIFSFIRI